MDDLLEQSARHEEDSCEYRLYPLRISDQPLDNLQAEILAWVMGTFARNYIWQKDVFNLNLDASATYLFGKIRFGDCIHDEWFVVWLLQQITVKWQMAACIEDNDGQFLLIEAANELPKWLSPANADNRVWFSHGRLHLIPIGVMPSDSAAAAQMEVDDQMQEVTVSDALKALSDPEVSTEAPLPVQKIITDRLAGFPGINETAHSHNTLAYLPKEVVILLQQYPALIASVVDIFYLRDQIQLRDCSKMARFPPETADGVQTQVRMTRPLYAQLVSQRFYPPKPFERAKWFAGLQEGTAEWRRRDLGMKIACGCEMLYAQTKASLKRTSIGLQNENHTTTSDRAMRTFMSRLEALGYFQGEREGSLKYRSLRDSAVAQFSIKAVKCRELPTFAQTVEQVKGSTTILAPSSLQEDSDSWLDLDEEQLEALLAAKSGQQGNAQDQDMDDAQASAQAERMTSVVGKLQSFLQGKGDLDGALFEDELSSDEDGDASEAIAHQSTAERKATLIPSLPASEWGEASQAKPSAPAVTVENQGPARSAPRLQPESYDGVEDDESGDEDDLARREAGLATEETADGATVVEDEIDMQQEMNDFLKFTREALGLSEDQYEGILKDRREAGSFVPPTSSEKPLPAVNFASPLPDTRPTNARNPRLDSFEALMDAMDAELHKKKAPTTGKIPESKGNLSILDEEARNKNNEPLDMDEELEAELNRLLQRDPDEMMEEDGQLPEVNLLKNLLSSFDSQQGQAGPVSNLFGRLDPSLKMPRNKDR